MTKNYKKNKHKRIKQYIVAVKHLNTGAVEMFAFTRDKLRREFINDIQRLSVNCTWATTERTI